MTDFESLYVWMACGFFLVWFILSILFQLDQPWFHRISQRDRFGLLPRWTFFAPNPGTSDYHLLYRDRLPDGGFTDWVEIPMIAERQLASCLWNPDKRAKKVLADVAMMLIESSRVLPPKDHSVLLVTLPYLILLNIVVNHQPALAGAKRQFVIAETLGFSFQEGPRLLMKSDLHAMV